MVDLSQKVFVLFYLVGYLAYTRMYASRVRERGTERRGRERAREEEQAVMVVTIEEVVKQLRRWEGS